MADDLHRQARAARDVVDGEEVAEVLAGAFYVRGDERPVHPRRARSTPKPEHYKVICISMYNDDLHRLDEMVDALKARGLTKASRSALIRVALEQLDLEKVPRGI
jgi:hypothetical protein